MALNLTAVFGTDITTDEFLGNSDTVRLMAQLPSFDSLGFSIQSIAGAEYYFSEDKVATLL